MTNLFAVFGFLTIHNTCEGWRLWNPRTLLIPLRAVDELRTESSGLTSEPVDISIDDDSLKKGRPHTAESRAKISAANKGKPSWNTGKKLSEETKQKIKEKN